uniref:hypothetical protein n=1 Tax=Tahibacter caeni TaxID=1453545 RepID=UPI002148FF86
MPGRPMRLWHRLFLLCAGLSVASLLGYAAWQQRAFASGFATYLDAVAVQRAEQVAVRLAGEYRERGGWDFLRRSPQSFGALTMNPSATRLPGDEARNRPPPDGETRLQPGGVDRPPGEPPSG